MLDSLSAVSSALGISNSIDLFWLTVGAALAGLVRGFAGFGTAMVFLPFAASVMSPVWAVTVLVVMDLIAPLILAPRTAKDGIVSDVLRLGVGCLFGLPIGVAVLLILPSEIFRYSVSAISLLLLALVVTGARFSEAQSKSTLYCVGWLGGIMGGAVGIAGPPVIMLYLASKLPAAVIRANSFLFLIVADFLILGAFAFQGILETRPVVVGVCISIIYLVGILAGARAFNPSRERGYRLAAYSIIAASAIQGLPVS